MAAITIKTNLKQVFGSLAAKFERLKDKDYLLRPVAVETIANMKDRIHIQGEAADGGQIGTYSNSYLKYREKNKRGASTKIIVSLTRQLENDWSVIATEKGYGIGFNNPFNLQKAKWVEEIKDIKIFQLTESEQQYVNERLNELIHDAFNT